MKRLLGLILCALLVSSFTLRAATARIIVRQGVPSLFVNNHPLAPYGYLFRPPAAPERIRDFAQAGIHLYLWGRSEIDTDVNDLGWIGPGKFDYRALDRDAQAIVDADSDAFLILRVTVAAPQWWLEAHPNDRLAYEDGRNHGPDQKKHATSMASALWREEAGDAFIQLIRHATSQPYGTRLIGFQIFGGVTEWFYNASSRCADFSPAALLAFQVWLAAKYEDEAALRRAWRDPKATFASAAIPLEAERNETSLGQFRNPAASRRVLDYFEFYHEVNADALLHFCRLGKAAAGEDLLIGSAFGYLLSATAGYADGSAPVNWGHQFFEQILAAPEIDFLSAPYQYTHRNQGGYDGSQTLPESIKRRGKLFFEELDNPTFRTISPSAHGFWGRPLPDKQESLDLMKRDFSQRLIRQLGMWWTDPFSDPSRWYYHDADIVDLLKETRALLKASASLDVRYQGEVAVFIDEETPFYVNPASDLLYACVYLQSILGLPRLGTTHDIYLHNDLANPALPEYSLYIFLNTWRLTAAERAVIRERVQRDQKVVLWMYAPGYIDETGASVDNISELTGITIRAQIPQEKRHRLGNKVYLTDFNHPITTNLSPGLFIGTDALSAPLFFADDPKARVLGRLLPSHGNGRTLGEHPGLVVKNLTNWTSIYASIPNLPAPLLRNIARFAGCHIYNEQDEVLYANSHFLALHAAKGGPKTFHLRRPTAVYDAFSRRLVADQTLEFTEEFTAFETRLYFLGDLSELDRAVSKP